MSAWAIATCVFVWIITGLGLWAWMVGTGQKWYNDGWEAARHLFEQKSINSNWLVRRALRAEELRVFWHGKYAIVKHENNQLRRKLDLVKNGKGKGARGE